MRRHNNEVLVRKEIRDGVKTIPTMSSIEVHIFSFKALTLVSSIGVVIFL